MNPYTLRRILDEAQARYFDYRSDDDIADFCDLVLELNEDDVDDYEIGDD